MKEEPRTPFHRFPRCLPALLATLCATLLACPALSQPSGGPYGPVQRRYEVPKDAAHVYYVAPDGDAAAAGETVEQPTTIETAFARVVTGDAIILRGGVYRTGELKLNQGVTIQPYADEQPVLKGTKIATEWEALRDGVWRTAWPKLFPQTPANWWRREREAMRTPLHRFHNDMVFVDGEFLQSAGWAGGVDEHSYFVDYETGHVYLGVDPTNRLVEITAWDGAIDRMIGEVHGKRSDGRGPVIRGITLTQYAGRALEIHGIPPQGPANPATYGKDVVGTTLEDVTFSFCSRVGGFLIGDRLVVRNCLVTDTSTEGLFIQSSSDVLLEKNIFTRNNIEHITGYFPAAVKIFNQTHRVTCRDNLVIDQPESSGIWYDVGNVDGRFFDNWVIGSNDGFFFEISKGAICAGNVFVDCNKGIRVLNSSNVQVYQNTFVNSLASFERTTRSAVADHFGWHPATGPDVDERDGHVFVNNLLAADASFDEPLIEFRQPAVLCDRLTEPQVARFDHNVYVRTGPTAQPLMIWSPARTETCETPIAALADLWQLRPSFEEHSRVWENYGGPLFQSWTLGHYGLQRDFPGMGIGTALPAEVQQALGWTDATAPSPGAFPVVAP